VVLLNRDLTGHLREVRIVRQTFVKYSVAL
jgi:hypothetical protein